MNPFFYLGLSIALLSFPLGFALGVNLNARDELRKFREMKMHLLCRVIE